MIRAQTAAAACDVLTSQSEADALEAAAQAERRRLRGLGAELALRLITLKLQRAVDDSSDPTKELPGLEPLVRAVVGLDPEQKQTAGAVKVEIVYRQEGRAEVGVGVSVER